MPFRVRTPDGELSYPTLLDVERAFHQGLVDPEDEVVDEATGSVQRAKDHPLLRPPPPKRFWQNQSAQPARIAVALSSPWPRSWRVLSSNGGLLSRSPAWRPG